MTAINIAQRPKHPKRVVVPFQWHPYDMSKTDISQAQSAPSFLPEGNIWFDAVFQTVYLHRL